MSEKPSYKDVINNEESLAIFLRAMKKFDSSFCDVMVTGVDFNLKIEIHGNKGELIHCRVYNDSFERPKKYQGKEIKRRPE
jgi:hypothetical protein